MKKEYLGDSVYAELDDNTAMIILTTDNGVEPSNTIYLEPETFLALQEYFDKHYL